MRLMMNVHMADEVHNDESAKHGCGEGGNEQNDNDEGTIKGTNDHGLERRPAFWQAFYEFS